MTRRRYPPEVAIIRQGDEGDEFYLIGEGSVDVHVREIGSDEFVSQLGVGEFFGEVALISGDPRNATVTTREEVLLYVLNKPDFQAALEASVSFRDQILKLYFQRQ